MISKSNYYDIKIPIPSLEKQQTIVAYLDYIYEKANKTSLTKIEELKQLNEFCLNNQKIFGENSVKELGEICSFKNGKGIKKDTLVDGEYPVIGGGQKPLGFHNEYNTNENTILCSSSGAYAGFISKYTKKVWASDCFSIMPKENLINNNYYVSKETPYTNYEVTFIDLKTMEEYYKDRQISERKLLLNYLNQKYNINLTTTYIPSIFTGNFNKKFRKIIDDYKYSIYLYLTIISYFILVLFQGILLNFN
jgi:hypothetical protein